MSDSNSNYLEVARKKFNREPLPTEEPESWKPLERWEHRRIEREERVPAIQQKQEQGQSLSTEELNYLAQDIRNPVSGRECETWEEVLTQAKASQKGLFVREEPARRELQGVTQSPPEEPEELSEELNEKLDTLRKNLKIRRAELDHDWLVHSEEAQRAFRQK